MKTKKKRRTRKRPPKFYQYEYEMIEEMLTEHAKKRKSQRGISIESILCALYFGSIYFSRKAQVMVIGRAEVEACPYDISTHKGIHIFFSNGSILTTFRNNSHQMRKTLNR